MVGLRVACGDAAKIPYRSYRMSWHVDAGLLDADDAMNEVVRELLVAPAASRALSALANLAG